VRFLSLEVALTHLRLLTLIIGKVFSWLALAISICLLHRSGTKITSLPFSMSDDRACYFGSTAQCLPPLARFCACLPRRSTLAGRIFSTAPPKCATVRLQILMRVVFILLPFT